MIMNYMASAILGVQGFLGMFLVNEPTLAGWSFLGATVLLGLEKGDNNS